MRRDRNNGRSDESNERRHTSDAMHESFRRGVSDLLLQTGGVIAELVEQRLVAWNAAILEDP